MRNACFRWVYLLVGGLVATGWVASGGCGSSGVLPTYQVEGKVVFSDGTPLKGGMVGFESITQEGTPLGAQGAIGPDGTFRLTTYEAGDGAVAGKHRVLVSGPLPPFDPSGLQPFEPVIHSRFGSYDTSGLRFTVKDDHNEFTIVVEPPQAPAP